MPEYTPEFVNNLRQTFKIFNHFMLFMWRLGLGRWINAWPEVAGRIMVLTHTGRKTGLRRRTPVNYAIVDGELYCVAGFGKISDWYLNMLANPQVEIWLPDGWWAGVAQENTDHEVRLPILRQVIIASGLAGHMFGLDAKKMTDEELNEFSKGYRLIHIRRGEARTGLEGPGDLSWIWPAATFILLPLVFILGRRKR
jgi:deazaflavin-dependent oxidoreductase (nitroreductase family)